MHSLCCIPPAINSEEELTLRTYDSMFYRLERMATSVFKWEGLPTEINPALIERYLFYYGNCVFYYDDIIEQYVVLPMSGEYAWDINYLPTEYEVVGFGGYRARLNYENSVVLYNDTIFSPGIVNSQLFATRLTNALRTGDMHLELQKVGKIVSVPETKKTGVKEIFKRIKNYCVYTFASPAAKELFDNVKVLDTELDVIIKDLDSHYSFIWHDAMSYYGITSMTNKLSGVSDKEVEAENAMARGNTNSLHEARNLGCKKINEMFGLNVTVGFGGEGNGQVYNDSENSNGISNGEDESGNDKSSTDSV